MKNKDIERRERKRNGDRDNNKTKKPISIFTGCLLTIIVMVLIGFLAGTSQTPKYEIVDEINIKNHLFNYHKIYYEGGNQTNAYVLILIPDNLDVPKEYTYIKYNDSLKYYSLINTFKQYKYFSENDLRQIKSWLKNVRVFTENTDLNVLTEEKNKINSEILSLNKERKKNYFSNMNKYLNKQSKEMQKKMDKMDKEYDEMMNKEFKPIE